MQNTRRSGRIALGTAAAMILAASSVWAGPRDHNEGFFLRLSGGGGGAQTELKFANNTEKFSGGGADFNFAVGGIVSPNLALHGTIWGWVLSDPDFTLNNLTAQANADITLGAAGVGLTYYFMPSNMYLSGSVGVGTLSLDAGNATFETDAGFVMDVTAGKEWWVGNKWGLGLAADFTFHAIPDGGVDANWRGPGFGLRFSATYN